ncbi:MAG: hypothetical protein ACOVOR_03605 [Rhabdochlamydiaceae bacterium]
MARDYLSNYLRIELMNRCYSEHKPCLKDKGGEIVSLTSFFDAKREEMPFIKT